LTLSASASRSMGVSVPYKRGQRRLWGTIGPSILGRGILERTRSTLLGLLGVTAAVGLGMVALALNQGWPLVAGGPIPGFGAQQEAVGKATVASTARAHVESGSTRGSASRQSASNPLRPRRRGAGGTTAPAGSLSPSPAGTVVSHSTPASPPTVASPPDPAPSSAPVESPSSSAPAPPSETSSPPQPVLAAHESDGHDQSRHPVSGTSSVDGHSEVEDHSGGSRSTTRPDPAPSPPATQPPRVETPETTETRQGAGSDDPSAGHGGGHGYGRGRR
jgi:hypothetical protein